MPVIDPGGGAAAGGGLLASLDQLAATLGVTFEPGSSQEARALQLLAGASSLVRRVARQHIDRVDDDQVTLQGNWSPLLVLPQRPVVSVADVAVENVPVEATLLGAWGGLRRDDGGRWGGTLSRVQVTYTHGFDPVPDWIVDIVTASAGRTWVNPEGVVRKQLDQYAVTFATGPDGEPVGLTEFEQALLFDLRDRR